MKKGLYDVKLEGESKIHKAAVMEITPNDEGVIYVFVKTSMLGIN